MDSSSIYSQVFRRFNAMGGRQDEFWAKDY